MSSHTCPRRDETVPLFLRADHDTDEWIENRCTWCGSYNPDLFIRLVAEGVEIGPTDKDYKAYLQQDDFAKFYFQHFSVEQRHHFIDMANAGRLNVGHPGHFYVTPFFMKIVHA